MVELHVEDNLDLFHHIFTLSLDGKLFLAPINPKPQRVLDLGMTQTPRDADFIWRAKLNAGRYGHWHLGHGLRR